MTTVTRFIGTGAWLNAAQQAHAAGWQGGSFVAAAHEAGVRVNAGDLFAAGADKPSAVRLCLSHEMDDRRVEEGLAFIARLPAGGGIVP